MFNLLPCIFNKKTISNVKKETKDHIVINKDFENIGVTVHLVDEGIDTGNIISKTHVNFENEKNISKAYRELLRLSSKVLADTTLEITKNRNINTISNEDGNYYSKIPIKKYLKAKKHFKHIGEK